MSAVAPEDESYDAAPEVGSPHRPPRDPPSSPPPIHRPSRHVKRTRQTATPITLAYRPGNDNTPETVVFSLLSQLPPELLQLVSDFLPSLNDIYNMRHSFKAAVGVDNDVHRRAVFNRAALSFANSEMWHESDQSLKSVKCSVCSSTLPPVRDFGLISRCVFPYCRAENAIRPAAILPSLTAPLLIIPNMMIHPGRVMLTVRRGAPVNGAIVLIRWRQFDQGAKTTGPWTVQYGGYRHSQSKLVVNPSTLDTTKLVQFSCAVRVKVCSCLNADGQSIPASECYTNYKQGQKCTASWSPWSPPSIPVYPPNKSEIDLFRHKISTINQTENDTETVLSSCSGSYTDSPEY